MYLSASWYGSSTDSLEAGCCNQAYAKDVALTLRTIQVLSHTNRIFLVQLGALAASYPRIALFPTYRLHSPVNVRPDPQHDALCQKNGRLGRWG